MTRILVVDDEPQILRALGDEPSRAGLRRRPGGDGGGGARRSRRGSTRTWSSSTSACRRSTGSRSSAAFAAGRRCRSSCSPSARERETRWTRSTRAPTTTSRSRSAWTSCSRGCGPRYAARSPGEEEAVVETGHFRADLAAKRVERDGEEIRLTPTEWQIVETLVRHPGRLITQRQLLQSVWGPQYEKETNYLRVYLAQIRRKLEPDPAKPRYFVTEPGMGYRFEP